MKPVIAFSLALLLITSTASAQANAPAPTVTKRDPVIEGLLIGTAAGFSAAWAFTRYNCGPAGFDRECEANVNIISYPAFVPIGAVTGALIDWSVGRQRVHVTPAIGRKGAALTATVQFGRR